MWAAYTQNCLCLWKSVFLTWSLFILHPISGKMWCRSVWRGASMASLTSQFWDWGALARICVLTWFHWVVTGTVRSELWSRLVTVWKNFKPQGPDFIQYAHLLCGFRLCVSVFEDILMYKWPLHDLFNTFTVITNGSLGFQSARSTAVGPGQLEKRFFPWCWLQLYKGDSLVKLVVF